jgi:hypothetical protein
MNEIVELIRLLAGQHNTLTLQRPYIKFTGSIEGGLLLSQIIYWSDRTNDENGWFYKSYAAWEEEICIKQKAVAKLTKEWKELGFLETKIQRIGDGTPMTHYRFLMGPFIEKLRDFLTDSSRERRLSRSAKSELVEGEKSFLESPLGRSDETTSSIGQDDFADRLSPPYIHQIHTSNTHIYPERVCVREKSTGSESEKSVIAPSESKILPVESSSIGEDNFSAAASLNSSVEGFPIGPWGRDLFSIHPGFMAAVIAKWRKGDTQKAKTFGSMVDEEVRGCIQKYWKKDWTNLQLDWTEYEDSTKRLAQTVRDRMTQGVEITSQEQKILTDRVMGPEHLRPQTPYSVPQQVLLNPERVSNHTSPSISVLPVAVTGISESELEETRRAIEAARPKLPPMTQKLFEGGKPVPDFMTWLMEETKNHAIPGMALRLIAVSLARRPEIQTAYLHSVSQDF